MVKIDIVDKICEKVASQIKKWPRLWKPSLISSKKPFNVRIRSRSRVWKFCCPKKEVETGPKPTDRERHRDQGKKDLNF